ncbi:MAG: MarR family transcriptional regulator [Alphaproteobacteria bacterium]|nr:MarR family transcriptional regulator [Alphaproteobacteria bacterium]
MSHSIDIPDNQQTSLRTWLRLLSAGNSVRKDLQSRLLAKHGISLSRFDILANLYRAPEGGIRLSELSRQLMVSNGNVTQVLTPLVKEGLVERNQCEDDARAAVAKLSKKGQHLFEKMAKDHASWVSGIFGNMTPEEQKNLTAILDKIVLSDNI